MSSDKTEKPTPRKLEDARKKGQVAKSTELNVAVGMFTMFLTILIYGPIAVGYLTRLVREYLTNTAVLTGNMDLSALCKILTITLGHMVLVVSPFLFAPMIVGVACNLLQIGPMLTTEPLMPKLEKINPLSGFKRLFSQKQAVELLKNIMKISLVSWVAYGVFQSKLPALFSNHGVGMMVGWRLTLQMIFDCFSAITLTIFVIGLADYLYQKYNMNKQLMMTRQEIKDEMKQMDGDQEIKNKIKRKGREIAQKTMLANVPSADVILVNPTHYSVAIQYDPDVSPAPRVVAKGVDHLALKIREIAKENKVPIYENPPLARALYAQVEVDHMISPELFVAVAEVLAWVFQKSKGRGKAKKFLTGSPNGGRR